MNKKKIYLTFDDGPTPKVTPWVLALLDKYQFKATFFCLGVNAMHHPELIEEILNHEHVIGNHGFEHLNGWKTNNKKYIRNTLKGSEILNTQLFRPPYGKISLLQWFMLRKKVKLVCWNFMPKDYLPLHKQHHFLKRLKNHTNENKIIVFHDSNKAFPTLQKYLEEYFCWLQANHFQPITIKK